MEQLRHRLTNVSPEGQRRSVDQNSLKRSDLDDFVACYSGGTNAVPPQKAGVNAPGYKGYRHERKETDRFKSFTYEELIKRDKVNLDIVIPSLPSAQSASRPSRLTRRTPAAQLWLKDEALEDSANLPAPKVIAADIVDDLQAALVQFAEIANDLKR